MSTVWSTSIGRYPHTEALFTQAVASPDLSLDLAAYPVINRAFAPMVRELRFDVSELAIATYLQARGAGVKLVLLPVVLAARFQESALLRLADGPVRKPADLIGRRIGARSYSQTTGLWVRGTLQHEYGVAPGDVRWITFEDAHVAGVADPAFAERAPEGADMLAMFRAGELDAIIVGTDPPTDERFRSVFENPDESARRFQDAQGFVPVNHVLTIRADAAAAAHGQVRTLLDLFAQSYRAAGADPRLALGRSRLEASVAFALRLAKEQELVPASLGLDEVWAGSPDWEPPAG